MRNRTLPGYLLVPLLLIGIVAVLVTKASDDDDTNEYSDDGGNCTTDFMIIDKINKTYERNKVPGGGGILDIVEIWVQDITSISDITSDFELDIYISEEWNDKGLIFDDLPDWCRMNVSLDGEMRHKLWMPNLCFINSKSASLHSSPFLNFFLMLYPSGTVWINYRLKLTGPCKTNLVLFPFDTNACELQFNSFNYNNHEVSMRWKEKNPVSILKEPELADYKLENITTRVEHVMYSAGLWDELWCTFQFRRRYGWYILQAYLPTYLTIFISWISFALGSKAIPARTMLGVNSLLAMTFQFGNIIRNLPRVSYVKAIDVWMLSCMSFVFCSLLELAWVGFLSRDYAPPPSKRTKRRRGNGAAITEIVSETVLESRNDSVQYRKSTNQRNQIGAINNDETKEPVCSGRNSPTTPVSVRQASGKSYHTLPLTQTVQSGSPFAKDFDYDYRPPGMGFGINGGINPLPVNDATPCRCSCSHSVRDTPITEKPQQVEAPSTDFTIAQIRKARNERRALMIDRASAFLFPTLFGIFNIFYWSYYLG